MFEDVVIAGYGTAVQRLPLAPDEAPLSTVAMINAATRRALEMAQIDRRQVDCLLTHRPPAGDSFLLFGQKLVAEMKIAPTSTTAIMNHGAGMLSALKYGAMLLEHRLARYVLCPSGDAAAAWLDNSVAVNANTEADAHFEAPYRPITPALYGQAGQRYVYENDISEEDLARVCVDMRANALDHPEAMMRDRGPLTVEDVISSPMIASPSRLLHCAPWYKGSRAGAIVLSRREDAPPSDRPRVHVRAVGETVTHEHISGRLGLSGFGPWKDGPRLAVTGAYPAARQAYEYAGFGIEDVDVIATPVPFAFLMMMILEDLGLCDRGAAAAFVASGALRAPGGPGAPAINTNGGSLSFGQSYLNCVMDQLLEVVQQLDGSSLGRQVENARRGLVHSHGGVMAAHTVALLETA
jgi:acetyl-CoA acetyltransferase